MLDANDDKWFRWGQQRHEGFVRTDPSPMFFDRQNHTLWLNNTYGGGPVFLIAGGPSFASLDHALLRQPSIVTMGLNNAVKTFRPALWCSVDSPDHFLRSIWFDPLIQKFVPICHGPKLVFDSDAWTFTKTMVRDCPNIVFYRRNEHFQPRQFLREDSINWGNHKSYGGGRSVMLAAFRILYLLGFRTIYLLGVDFRMDDHHHYHFQQQRSRGSISGNNETYKKLCIWFAELRPIFEAAGLRIFNCNPESGLKAFDFVSFEDAVKASVLDVDVVNERTSGLYDTKTDDKVKGIGK